MSPADPMAEPADGTIIATPDLEMVWVRDDKAETEGELKPGFHWFAVHEDLEAYCFDEITELHEHLIFLVRGDVLP